MHKIKKSKQINMIIIIIIIIINGLFQVINNRVYGYKQSQTVCKFPPTLLPKFTS